MVESKKYSPMAPPPAEAKPEKPDLEIGDDEDDLMAGH